MNQLGSRLAGFKRATKASLAALALGLAVVIIAPFVLGFGGGILTLILVGICVYFGMIGVLARSILVGIILKLTQPMTASVIQIWMPDSPKMTASVELLASTGYFTTIMWIFALLATLSALTNSIKLFNITNNTEVKNQIE